MWGGVARLSSLVASKDPWNSFLNWSCIAEVASCPEGCQALESTRLGLGLVPEWLIPVPLLSVLIALAEHIEEILSMGTSRLSSQAALPQCNSTVRHYG